MSDDVRLNPVMVARRCACRNYIIGPENPHPVVAEAVITHQVSEPHRSWDREAWVERNTAQVQVPTILRRVA